MAIIRAIAKYMNVSRYINVKYDKHFRRISRKFADIINLHQKINKNIRIQTKQKKKKKKNKKIKK